MTKLVPRITLTDFMDVVVKAGTPKATAIKTIKHRGDYSPATDFYKALREKIVETHRKNGDRKALGALLPGLTDEKKIANYPAAVSGYSKWWGKQKFEWFDPPTGVLQGSGIELAVSPELGLVVGGIPHVLKLNLKSDSLAINRADIINHVLVSLLHSKAPAGAVFGVVDARRSRLLLPSGKVPQDVLSAMVTGELEYISHIWKSV